MARSTWYSRPRFWRLWGHGLRGGFLRRFRREDRCYEWWPVHFRLHPFRGRFAWWRGSLLDWHGVQTGWFGHGGGRVMSHVFHVGPLLVIFGQVGRRPRRGHAAPVAFLAAALLTLTLPAGAQDVLHRGTPEPSAEFSEEVAAWKAALAPKPRPGSPAASAAMTVGAPLYTAFADPGNPRVSLYVLGGDSPDLEAARAAGATLTARPFTGADGKRYAAFLVRYPMRDVADFDARYGPGSPGWRWACPHAPHVGDAGARQVDAGAVLEWAGYANEPLGRGELQISCSPLYQAYFAAHPVEGGGTGGGTGSTGGISCASPRIYTSTPREALRCQYFPLSGRCRLWKGWTPAFPRCCPGVECPAEPSFCGDGRCDTGEDCLICTQDCGACPEPPDPCGDNVCDEVEFVSGSCPADCPVDPPSPPGTCSPPAEVTSLLGDLEDAAAAMRLALDRALAAYREWATTTGTDSTGRLDTVLVEDGP